MSSQILWDNYTIEKMNYKIRKKKIIARIARHTYVYLLGLRQLFSRNFGMHERIMNYNYITLIHE